MFDHVGDLIEVFVAGRKTESTYHHPYWVVEGQNLNDRPNPDHVVSAEVSGTVVPGRWVDAGDLQIGDIMLLLDGRRLPVEEILGRHVHDHVYNFAVDGLHNYGVGPDCVLIHNNCAAPIPGGVTITFGHGARHLAGTGLSQSAVEAAISQEIQALAAKGAQFAGGFWGRLSVTGQTVEFRAMTLLNGIINVGTYYLP
ncbi:MAG: hypothetical protein HY288_07405 [Planctomycetia bacterium]|nr:hypothetical protein [Planctomycetia bacterium]